MAAAEQHGRQLYLDYGCALCHGLEGRGDGPNARSFDPRPADFHGPKAFRHGADHDSLRRSIRNGIKEDKSIMPAFEDIPADEMDEIINYLQSLRSPS